MLVKLKFLLKMPTDSPPMHDSSADSQFDVGWGGAS
jgi:hypothetical protein